MRLHRSEPAVTERTLTADDFTNALLEGVIKDIQWVENKYSNIASLAFIKDGLANLRREAASRLIPKPPQKRSGIHLVNGVIPLEIMLQAMRLYWEAGQRDKATAVASSYAGARKTFDAQCALEGKVREQLDNIAERVHNKQLQPPLALTEAKKIVDGCIALAGTTGVPGVRLSEFYGQANDFVLARSAVADD